MIKYFIAGFLALVLAGCGSSSGGDENAGQSEAGGAAVTADTMLYVSDITVDSVPFIKLQMNPEAAYVTVADSVIPSESDTKIALCVEAAFTGELLKEFKTTNVAGDYVIDGRFRKGYKCRANTGFLYADKDNYVISSSKNCSEWIKKAKADGGSLFQQVLIVQNGRNVYGGKPIKPGSLNIYRSACIMNDSSFAVIQSKSIMALKDFIASLIKMGVRDAIYLDMGGGWNYGWYRPTEASEPVKLFRYRTTYQTNWLVIKAKES